MMPFKMLISCWCCRHFHWCRLRCLHLYFRHYFDADAADAPLSPILMPRRYADAAFSYAAIEYFADMFYYAADLLFLPLPLRWCRHRHCHADMILMLLPPWWALCYFSPLRHYAFAMPAAFFHSAYFADTPRCLAASAPFRCHYHFDWYCHMPWCRHYFSRCCQHTLNIAIIYAIFHADAIIMLVIADAIAFIISLPISRHITPLFSPYGVPLMPSLLMKITPPWCRYDAAIIWCRDAAATDFMICRCCWYLIIFMSFSLIVFLLSLMLIFAPLLFSRAADTLSSLLISLIYFLLRCYVTLPLRHISLMFMPRYFFLFSLFSLCFLDVFFRWCCCDDKPLFRLFSLIFAYADYWYAALIRCWCLFSLLFALRRFTMRHWLLMLLAMPRFLIISLRFSPCFSHFRLFSLRFIFDYFLRLLIMLFTPRVDISLMPMFFRYWYFIRWFRHCLRQPDAVIFIYFLRWRSRLRCYFHAMLAAAYAANIFCWWYYAFLAFAFASILPCLSSSLIFMLFSPPCLCCARLLIRVCCLFRFDLISFSRFIFRFCLRHACHCCHAIFFPSFRLFLRFIFWCFRLLIRRRWLFRFSLFSPRLAAAILLLMPLLIDAAYADAITPCAIAAPLSLLLLPMPLMIMLTLDAAADMLTPFSLMPPTFSFDSATPYATLTPLRYFRHWWYTLLIACCRAAYAWCHATLIIFAAAASDISLFAAPVCWCAPAFAIRYYAIDWCQRLPLSALFRLRCRCLRHAADTPMPLAFHYAADISPPWCFAMMPPCRHYLPLSPHTLPRCHDAEFSPCWSDDAAVHYAAFITPMLISFSPLIISSAFDVIFAIDMAPPIRCHFFWLFRCRSIFSTFSMFYRLFRRRCRWCRFFAAFADTIFVMPSLFITLSSFSLFRYAAFRWCQPMMLRLSFSLISFISRCHFLISLMKIFDAFADLLADYFHAAAMAPLLLRLLRHDKDDAAADDAAAIRFLLPLDYYFLRLSFFYAMFSLLIVLCCAMIISLPFRCLRHADYYDCHIFISIIDYAAISSWCSPLLMLMRAIRWWYRLIDAARCWWCHFRHAPCHAMIHTAMPPLRCCW